MVRNFCPSDMRPSVAATDRISAAAAAESSVAMIVGGTTLGSDDGGSPSTSSSPASDHRPSSPSAWPSLASAAADGTTTSISAGTQSSSTGVELAAAGAVTADPSTAAVPSMTPCRFVRVGSLHSPSLPHPPSSSIATGAPPQRIPLIEAASLHESDAVARCVLGGSGSPNSWSDVQEKMGAYALAIPPPDATAIIAAALKEEAAEGRGEEEAAATTSTAARIASTLREVLQQNVSISSKMVDPMNQKHKYVFNYDVRSGGAGAKLGIWVRLSEEGKSKVKGCLAPSSSSASVEEEEAEQQQRVRRAVAVVTDRFIAEYLHAVMARSVRWVETLVAELSSAIAPRCDDGCASISELLLQPQSLSASCDSVSASNRTCTDDGPRLIVIGPVHGCMATLERLVYDECRYDPLRGDRLLFLGNLVGKGPPEGSEAVVQFARKNKALAVMGKYDLKAVLWHRAREGWWVGGAAEDAEGAFQRVMVGMAAEAVAWHWGLNNSIGDDEAVDDSIRGLSPESIAYLASLPHVIRVIPRDGSSSSSSSPPSAPLVFVSHGAVGGFSSHHGAPVGGGTDAAPRITVHSLLGLKINGSTVQNNSCGDDAHVNGHHKGVVYCGRTTAAILPHSTDAPPSLSTSSSPAPRGELAHSGHPHFKCLDSDCVGGGALTAAVFSAPSSSTCAGGASVDEMAVMMRSVAVHDSDKNSILKSNNRGVCYPALFPKLTMGGKGCPYGPERCPHRHVTPEEASEMDCEWYVKDGWCPATGCDLPSPRSMHEDPFTGFEPNRRAICPMRHPKPSEDLPKKVICEEYRRHGRNHGGCQLGHECPRVHTKGLCPDFHIAKHTFMPNVMKTDNAATDRISAVVAATDAGHNACKKGLFCQYMHEVPESKSKLSNACPRRSGDVFRNCLIAKAIGDGCIGCNGNNRNRTLQMQSVRSSASGGSGSGNDASNTFGAQ